MNPYSVLQRPVLSEKADRIREEEGKYTFVIHPKATKLDVKAAVETLFKVNVVRVNTNVTRGKQKRRGAKVYRTSNKKKAIVTLTSGQKLEIFEN